MAQGWGPRGVLRRKERKKQTKITKAERENSLHLRKQTKIPKSMRKPLKISQQNQQLRDKFTKRRVKQSKNDCATYMLKIFKM